ncbi:MAG TPA: GPW/gp25 family protein [bacterium]|nr:GPW/gp25 family protein [bacterium]
MAQQKPFLGSGWNFPPTFNKHSRSVEMVEDEADIHSSLHILLSTGVGERIMQPTYGCDLRDLIFEPVDTALQTYIKDLVRTAILYHEPRIRLEEVRLRPKQEEGLLKITVEYTVKATNARANFVYPFYKEEGSEVS